jgi:hypothetical protein
MQRNAGTSRARGGRRGLAVTAAAGAALALGTLGTATGTAAASGAPPAGDLSAARAAATAPATLDTLSRFFARDGAVRLSAAAPRAEGTTVPVRVLSREFAAGKAGAPVARTEFLATQAVSSDGQRASVWTVRQGTGWQVVNIATGDDEFRYTALGEKRLPGGTVFREPQTDSWFAAGGGRVVPLDEDAVREIGAGGVTLAAYRERVRAAYGDKQAGSAYARKGMAGGYGPAPGSGAAAPSGTTATASATPAGEGTALVTAVGTGAAAVLALGAVMAFRARRGT